MCIFVTRLISESLRWLISRGRLKKTEKLISKSANENQVALPSTIKDQLQQVVSRIYRNSDGSLALLFKQSRTRKHLIILSFLWSVILYLIIVPSI